MSVDLEQPDVVGPAEPDYEAYRALSALAVTALVLGVFAALTFVHWVFALIAIPGVIVGFMALRAIRERPGELTGKLFAKLGIVLSLVSLVGGLTFHSIVYATEVPEGYERVAYSQLQPETASPDDIVALDGKKIFIKGYMYPGAQQEGIQQFILVRDNGDCCFGGKPKLTDMIAVNLQEPLTVNYKTRLRNVAGVFHVRPPSTAGEFQVLYHLDADYAK